MKKFKQTLPKVIFATVITILLALAFLLIPNSTSYNAPQEPVTVEKEVVVPEINKLIEEAQTEAQDRVEAEAQEAYDYAYDQAMTEIATQVRDEYIADLEAVNQADKEKLQSY